MNADSSTAGENFNKRIFEFIVDFDDGRQVKISASTWKIIEGDLIFYMPDGTPCAAFRYWNYFKAIDEPAVPEPVSDGRAIIERSTVEQKQTAAESVQRCQNCRFWERDNKFTDTGVCLAGFENHGFKLFLNNNVSIPEDGITMETVESFSCAAFQKEASDA